MEWRVDWVERMDTIFGFKCIRSLILVVAFTFCSMLVAGNAFADDKKVICPGGSKVENTEDCQVQPQPFGGISTAKTRTPTIYQNPFGGRRRRRLGHPQFTKTPLAADVDATPSPSRMPEARGSLELPSPTSHPPFRARDLPGDD